MNKSYHTLPNKIYINLSSSFMAKARCKYCGKIPTYYYAGRNPVNWYSAKNSINYYSENINFISRLCSDVYLFNDPKDFNSESYFSFNIGFYKKYKPTLHRVRGVDPVFMFTEYLTCKCGLSAWAFADNHISRRLEIINRKSRYKYPNIIKLKY